MSDFVAAVHVYQIEYSTDGGTLAYVLATSVEDAISWWRHKTNLAPTIISVVQQDHAEYVSKDALHAMKAASK